MSDFAQGAGWWQASDGKWYAPELHPDAQAAAQQAQPVTATYATAPAYQTEQSVQSAAYAQPSPGQAQQPFQQQQPAQTFQQQPFQQQQPAQTIPYPQPQPAGPGWWQASDGNWYPPELHPDAQVAAQQAQQAQQGQYTQQAQQAQQAQQGQYTQQAQHAQQGQYTQQAQQVQQAQQPTAYVQQGVNQPQQHFQQQQPAQTIPYPQPQPAGPGWWQASDGNWYPPELHPDAQVAATASAGWAAPGTQAPFLAGSGWDQGAAGGVGPPAKTKKLKLFRKKK